MTNDNFPLRDKLVVLIVAIAAFVLATQAYLGQVPTASAQAARFDYVTIVSPVYLYRGQRGLLLLDRRNGNVWFMPEKDGAYQDPSFVLRVPFEKLDQQL
jgi:hypothetical protein